MFLSIIIPFFNEQNRLPLSLAKIIAYFNNNKENFDYEIILVDDGSNDLTIEKIRRYLDLPQVKLYQHKSNLGKGAAVKTGVLYSQGDYILFSDTDLSTPIEEIEKFLPHMTSNFDIIIGSRTLDQKLLLKKQPFYRQMIGKFGNFLIKGILRLPYKDTQCGFKLFRRDIAFRLFSEMKMKRWSFDYEILYLAQKYNLRVKELAVKWINSEDSKFNPIFDSIQCFFDLIKIRIIH